MKQLLLAASAAMLCASPASAAPVDLGGFNAVEASGRLDVEISMGPTFAVDISGPHTDRVEARVRGDTLVLSTRNGWFQMSTGPDAHVRITMPVVRGIDSSAGVEVNARDIRADGLELGASSGSELTVTGACASLSVDASSGASLHAAGLRCATVTADASSGASAAIYASQRADIDASSGADIRLEGEGQIGNVSLSSGAELHHH